MGLVGAAPVAPAVSVRSGLELVGGINRNVLGWIFSRGPTKEVGKEKEKDCVSINFKGSVKMKQIHFLWLL